MTTNEIKQAVKCGGVLKTYSLEQVTTGATQIVSRAFKLKGLSPNPENIRFCIEVLVPKLTEKYNYLTIGEVRLAIEEGCTTGFGSSLQLTPANLVAWVDAYVKCPERKEVAEEIRRGNYLDGKKVAAMLPPEQKAERDRRFNEEEPRRAYEEFLREPTTWEISATGYGHVLYNAIRSQGKLGQVKDETLAEARRRAEKRTKVHVDPFTRAAEKIDENVLEHRVESELVQMFFLSLWKAGKGPEYFTPKKEEEL